MGDNAGMSERDLARALDRYSDAIMEYVSLRVQQALALERDKHDEAIAELRDELLKVAQQVSDMRAAYSRHLSSFHPGDPAQHSVKVPE